MPGIPGYEFASVYSTTPDGRVAIGEASASNRPNVDIIWTPSGVYELLPRLEELGVDFNGRSVDRVLGISADATRIAVNLSRPGTSAHPGVVVVHGLMRLCDADFDGDGFLTSADLASYSACFQGGAAPRGSRGADFNADGFIDMFDWIAFVDAYDAGCSR